MNAARLEELARECDKWHDEMDITDEDLRADFRDLARCAREVVLLRRVAVRAVMLLERLKSEAPEPRHSVLVNMARKNLQAAINAVGLTEEAESGIK